MRKIGTDKVDDTLVSRRLLSPSRYPLVWSYVVNVGGFVLVNETKFPSDEKWLGVVRVDFFFRKIVTRVYFVVHLSYFFRMRDDAKNNKVFFKKISRMGRRVTQNINYISDVFNI